MPSVQLAPISNPNGYTEGYGWSYYPCPVTRLDGSGGRAMQMTRVGLHVAGRYAARNVQFYVANSNGSYIAGSGLQTIGSGSGSAYNEFGVNGFTDGIGQQIRYGWDNSSGSVNFSRSASGTLYSQYGNYTGQLAGYLYWAECPSAPSTPTLTLGGGGQVTTSFSGSGVNNGGAGVNRWTLQYADNSSFVNPSNNNSNGGNTFTLTPGKQYWFRACGHNSVTDGLGRFGAWSAASTAVMLAGGQVRDGGSFRPADTKIMKSSSWVTATVDIRENGAWRPAK